MGTSFHLEWKNLGLKSCKSGFNFRQCKRFAEEKTILSDVSGSLRSGQLIAVIGGSGAGKTTLLAAISYRFRGPLEGQLSLNGKTIDRKTMTNMSCFIPQFDMTLNTLTPNEYLYLMAELKLNRHWSRARKDQRIATLLHELGLEGVASNRISTLSGGERKKLNLITDLLTDPPIIFCDEITTGLDSFNAKKVIGALKYLSNTNANSNGHGNGNTNGNANGNWGSASSEMKIVPRNDKRVAKAIICSIHQPTSEIFECFSEIILMHGGRAVFQGETHEAFDSFSRLGFHCPPSYNPADFFVKILFQTDGQVTLMNKSKSDSNHLNGDCKTPVDFVRPSYQNHNSLWIKQVWVLVQRACIDAKRRLKELLIAFLISLIPYTAIGLLYPNLSVPTQENVQNIEGVFFIFTIEIVFSTMYRILRLYLNNTPLLRRETNERIYGVSSFYVASCLTDLPFFCLRTLFGLSIAYHLVGFHKGVIFFLELWLTNFLLAFTANAYGLMLVGIFRAIILDVPPVFNQIFVSLSGAYASVADYPKLKYTSIFYYGCEAMSILYWHDVSEIACSSISDDPCAKNGTEVLQNKSFHTEGSDAFVDLLELFLLGIGMHVVALIGIRRYIKSAGYY